MAITALTGTIRTMTATPASTDGPRICRQRRKAFVFYNKKKTKKKQKKRNTHDD